MSEKRQKELKEATKNAINSSWCRQMLRDELNKIALKFKLNDEEMSKVYHEAVDEIYSDSKIVSVTIIENGKRRVVS